MSDVEEVRIVVRRQWNDYRKATYLLNKMRNFHWTDISGGMSQAANQPYIHAYVWCNAMESGEVAHSCSHGPGPHEIKVCIVKKDNPKTFPIVLALAGPKPGKSKS